MRPPCFIIGRTAKPSFRRRPVNSTLDRGARVIRTSRLHRTSAYECKTKTNPPRQRNLGAHRSNTVFDSIRKMTTTHRATVTRLAVKSGYAAHRAANGEPEFAARAACSSGQRPARQSMASTAVSAHGLNFNFAPRASRGTTHSWRLAKAQNRRLTWRSTGPATACHPGRAAALAHHRPHGQGVTPHRAG